MATRTLTYVLLGQDRLSPVAEKAGATVEGSFSRIGGVLGNVGKVMAATGAVVAVESVRAATAFQTSMERIHTQAGGSQRDVEALSSAVLKLAPSTQQGPEQLAEALYHLKSVGMSNADAMKALSQASNLAAVGGANLEETTNALAGAWRSGIRGAQSFGMAAGTVNAIIGAGNMKMQDFVDAIGTGILPSAKTFGLSLGQVGAGLALMTDEGVPAVDAATRLRMSFSLLGAPSGAAEKQLKKIGLTGLELANTMRGPSGLVGTIALLKDHLDKSGLSASQQAEVLSHAFGGGRSSSAILTMVNNLDVLRKKQDQINATTGKFGDAVVAQRKTAQAQFAMLRSTLDTVGIRIGEALLPPIVKFMQLVNGGLGSNVGRVFSTVSNAVMSVGKSMIQAFGPAVMGFIRAIVTFGGQLLTAFRNLLPVLIPLARLFGTLVGAAVITSLKLLGMLLVSVIGPALRGLTGLIGQHHTLFEALAVAIIAVTTAIYVQRVAMAGWGAAAGLLRQGLGLLIKGAWALNAALDANPIGIITLALIALGAAFYVAWTKSATFRNAVKDVGTAMIAAGIVVIAAARDITNAFLTMVGTILHGVADAFGWVPGLGGKLKSASKSFDNFKAGVNSSFDSIISHMQNWQSQLTGAIAHSHDATNKIVADLNHQRDAAKNATTDLGKYSDSIHKNAVDSDAAKAARLRLYNDLVNAGIKSTKAHDDINAYTAAVRKHGTDSDAARGPRLRLENDIKQAFLNSEQGKIDLDKLSEAIRNHGTKSDQARGARLRLETDLTNSGVDANTAKRLVDNLQTSISRMHGTTVHVNFVGSGSGSIYFNENTGVGGNVKGGLKFMAAGGMITGGIPGKDSVLGFLMPGEVVVPEKMVKAGAVDHLRGKLPRFAAGGRVPSPGGGYVEITGATGNNGMFSRGQPYMQSVEANFGKIVENAFAKAVVAKFKRDMAAAIGNGPAIVSYARSWLGKIPYVWGGTAVPGGADCSGFVQTVYKKFGITAPRTSEAQYAWAKKSPPTPGGLAFYISPAGGPPPGHVAIVADANHVVSQGGGMGPQWETLRFMPLMGTGVPPQGFPGSVGGVGNGPVPKGTAQQIAQALLNQYGWGNQWGSFYNLEMREAGFNMNARNPSSGAYGMAQFINGAGEYAQYGGNWYTAAGQLTAMMNYIRQRYGSPNAAWAHEVSAGWYDRGGWLKPGWNLAYNGLGRPEPVGATIGGGDIHVHVNVRGHALASKQEIAREVSDALAEFKRKGGKV